MKNLAVLVSLITLLSLTAMGDDGNIRPIDLGTCTVNGHNVVLQWGNQLDPILPPGEDDSTSEDGEVPILIRTIVVYRDGEQIAILRPTEVGYVDRNVPNGEHTYTVVSRYNHTDELGIMAPELLLLRCTVVVKPYDGPRNLQCRVVCPIDPNDPDNDPANSDCRVLLTWQNPINYLGILIGRDNQLLALLPGNAQAWTDEEPPAGRHNYKVYGIIPGILPAEATDILERYNEEPSDAVKEEALVILKHHLIRLSQPAICTVNVPYTGPQGPYNLRCIVVDINTWDLVPELADVSPERLPVLPFKGVLLVWRNPKFYESITISRDGERIAMIPGTSWYYLDPRVAPGEHVYEVDAFDMGMPVKPARCKVKVPGPTQPPAPVDLTCRVLCIVGEEEIDIQEMPDEACMGCPFACNVVMQWRNPANYGWIVITRDGEPIARVPGITNRFVDRDPPQGPHTYGVYGIRDGLASEETLCRVYVPDPPPVRPPHSLTCVVACTEPVTGELCGNVSLAWENGQNYEWVVITRNGDHVARVPGITTSYVDTDVPEGIHVYAVMGYVNEQISRPALCKVQIPDPPLKPPYDLVCLPNIGPEPIVDPEIVVDPADVVIGEDGEIIIPPINAVYLRWRNGSRYDAILIQRNGEDLVKLDGDAMRYIDHRVEPGTHKYAVYGVRDNEMTEPATCEVTITGPTPTPENLTCELLPNMLDPTSENGILGPAAKLTWENPVEYDVLLLFRNRGLIAKLEGGTTAYVDHGLLPGDYVYGLVGVVGNSQSLPAVCEISVPGPVPPPQDLTCEPMRIDDCTDPDGTRCEGGVVRLTWHNPVRYARITILRDGEDLVQLPGQTERYYDRTVEPGGTYAYAVIGIINNGTESEPVKCEVTVPSEPLKPPYDLACATEDTTVYMKWMNGDDYAAIVIIRDKVEIIRLPGTATTYEDQGVAIGRHLYEVYGIGENGVRSAGVRCVVEVEGPNIRNLLHFGRNLEILRIGAAMAYADNKDPLEAWSFGICNNQDIFVPTDATIEGTFAAELNEGEGPGFLSIAITESGVTMAAIVQQFPPVDDTPGALAIEPGKNRSLLDVSYKKVSTSMNIILEDNSLHTVKYCSKLGDPPVTTLFVVNGYEVYPATLPGVVVFEQPAPVEFVRGDANADGAHDLGDVIKILDYLFGDGEAPVCLQAADANESDEINLADPVYLLNWLFADGDKPSMPYPDCGISAQDDIKKLTCDSFPPCE